MTRLDLSAALKAHVEQVLEESAKRPKPYEARLPENQFPAASLSAWLGVADRAGVPIVPAEIVAEIPLKSIIHFDCADDNERRDLLVLDRVNQVNVPGTMLRWDCCAGYDIKAMMGAAGEGSAPTEVFLTPDDPRAFEILYAFPVEKVKLLRRPWIEAEMDAGFPVEFRVFVFEGQVKAVSSYYPQRPLAATSENIGYAMEAVRFAESMVGQLEFDGRCPCNPGQKSDEVTAVTSTMDFMVERSTGKLLFLEAGPGFGFGAHPCCFFNSKERQVDVVEGIKLEVGVPAIAFDEATSINAPTP